MPFENTLPLAPGELSTSEIEDKVYSTQDLISSGMLPSNKEESTEEEDPEKIYTTDELIKRGSLIDPTDENIAQAQIEQFSQFGNPMAPITKKLDEVDKYIDLQNDLSDLNKGILKDQKFYLTPEQFQNNITVLSGKDPKQLEDNFMTRAVGGAIRGTGLGLTISGAAALTGVGAVGTATVTGITAAALGLKEGFTDEARFYYDEQGVAHALGIGELPPKGMNIASKYTTPDSASDDNPATLLMKSLYNGFSEAEKMLPNIASVLYGLGTGGNNRWIDDMNLAVDNIKLDYSEEANKPWFGVDEKGDFTLEPTVESTIKFIGEGAASMMQFVGAVGGAKALGIGAKQSAKTASQVASEYAGKAPSLLNRLKMNASNPAAWTGSFAVNVGESARNAREAGLDGRTAYAFVGMTGLGMAAVEIMVGGMDMNLLNKRKIFKGVAESLKKESIDLGESAGEKIASNAFSKESLDKMFKGTIKGGMREIAQHGGSILKNINGEGMEEGVQNIWTEAMMHWYNAVNADGTQYDVKSMFSKEATADHLNNYVGGVLGAGPFSFMPGGHEIAKTRDRNLMDAVEEGKAGHIKKILEAAAKQGQISQDQLQETVTRLDQYQSYKNALGDNAKGLSRDQRRELFEASLQYDNAKQISDAQDKRIEAGEASGIELAKQKAFQKETKKWQDKIGQLITAKPEEDEAINAETNVQEQGSSIESPEEKPAEPVKRETVLSQAEKAKPYSGSSFKFTAAYNDEVSLEDGNLKINDEEPIPAHEIEGKDGEKYIVSVQEPSEDGSKPGRGFVIKEEKDGSYSYDEFGQGDSQDKEFLPLESMPEYIRNISPDKEETKKKEAEKKKAEELKKKEQSNSIFVQNAKIQKTSAILHDERVGRSRDRNAPKLFYSPGKEKSTVTKPQEIFDELGIESPVENENPDAKIVAPHPELNYKPEEIGGGHIKGKIQTGVEKGLSIVNGMLHVEGKTTKLKTLERKDGDGNVVQEKGDYEVVTSEKKIPLHKVVDKDGNKYLVAVGKTSEGVGDKEGHTFGTTYLFMLNDDGDILRTHKFYAQKDTRNGKLNDDAHLYDDFIKWSKYKGLKADTGEPLTDDEKLDEALGNEKPKPKKVKVNKFKNSKELIKAVRENVSNSKLNPNDHTYTVKDENGNMVPAISAGTAIKGGISIETSNNKSALIAGSTVDKIGRDFFLNDGILPESNLYPDEIRDEALVSLYAGLRKVFNGLLSSASTAYTEQIILHSELTPEARETIAKNIKKHNEANKDQIEIVDYKYVAGEIDALVVSRFGKIWIYDFKTTASEKGISASTKGEYGKKQTLYARMFEKMYGVKVEGIKIVEINIARDGVTGKVNGVSDVKVVDLAFNDTDSDVLIGKKDDALESDDWVKENMKGFSFRTPDVMPEEEPVDTEKTPAEKEVPTEKEPEVDKNTQGRLEELARRKSWSLTKRNDKVAGQVRGYGYAPRTLWKATKYRRSAKDTEIVGKDVADYERQVNAFYDNEKKKILDKKYEASEKKKAKIAAAQKLSAELYAEISSGKNVAYIEHNKVVYYAQKSDRLKGQVIFRGANGKLIFKGKEYTTLFKKYMDKVEWIVLNTPSKSHPDGNFSGRTDQQAAEHTVRSLNPVEWVLEFIAELQKSGEGNFNKRGYTKEQRIAHEISKITWKSFKSLGDKNWFGKPTENKKKLDSLGKPELVPTKEEKEFRANWIDETSRIDIPLLLESINGVGYSDETIGDNAGETITAEDLLNFMLTYKTPGEALKTEQLSAIANDLRDNFYKEFGFYLTEEYAKRISDKQSRIREGNKQAEEGNARLREGKSQDTGTTTEETGSGELFPKVLGTEFNPLTNKQKNRLLNHLFNRARAADKRRNNPIWKAMEIKLKNLKADKNGNFEADTKLGWKVKFFNPFAENQGYHITESDLKNNKFKMRQVGSDTTEPGVLRDEKGKVISNNAIEVVMNHPTIGEIQVGYLGVRYKSGRETLSENLLEKDRERINHFDDNITRWIDDLTSQIHDEITSSRKEGLFFGGSAKMFSIVPKAILQKFLKLVRASYRLSKNLRMAIEEHMPFLAANAKMKLTQGEEESFKNFIANVLSDDTVFPTFDEQIFEDDTFLDFFAKTVYELSGDEDNNINILSSSEQRFDYNNKIHAAALFTDFETGNSIDPDHTKNQLMEMSYRIAKNAPSNITDVRAYYISEFKMLAPNVAKEWETAIATNPDEKYTPEMFIRIYRHHKNSFLTRYIYYHNQRTSHYSGGIANPGITVKEAESELESKFLRFLNETVGDNKTVLEDDDKIGKLLAEFTEKSNSLYLAIQEAFSRRLVKDGVMPDTGDVYAIKYLRNSRMPKEELQKYIDMLANSPLFKQYVNMELKFMEDITGIEANVWTSYQNFYLSQYKEEYGYRDYPHFIADKLIRGGFNTKTKKRTNIVEGKATELRSFIISELNEIKGQDPKNQINSFKHLFVTNKGTTERGQVSTLAQAISEQSAIEGNLAWTFSDVEGNLTSAMVYHSALTRMLEEVTTKDVQEKYPNNKFIQYFKNREFRVKKTDGLSNKSADGVSKNRAGLKDKELDLIPLIDFFSADNERMAGKGNYFQVVDQQADSSNIISHSVQKHTGLSESDIIDLYTKVRVVTGKESVYMTRAEAKKYIDNQVSYIADQIKFFGSKGWLKTPLTEETDFYDKTKLSALAKDFVYNYAYNKYYIDEYLRGKADRNMSVRMTAKRKTDGQGKPPLTNIPGGLTEHHWALMVNDPEIISKLTGNVKLKLTDGQCIVSAAMGKQIEVSTGNESGGIIKSFVYWHDNDEENLVKSSDIVLPALDDPYAQDFFNENPEFKKFVEAFERAQIDRMVFDSSAKQWSGDSQMNVKWKSNDKGYLEDNDYSFDSSKRVKVPNSEMRIMLELTNDGMMQPAKLPIQVLNLSKSTPVGKKIDTLIEQASKEKLIELQDQLGKSDRDVVKWLIASATNNEDLDTINTAIDNGVAELTNPIVRNILNKYFKSLTKKKLLNMMIPKMVAIQSRPPGINLKDKELKNYEVIHGEAYFPANSIRSEMNPHGLEEGELVFIIRTPADDLHSMEPVRVKGFLPPNMKNAIVTATGVQYYSGNDLDGDGVHVWSKYRNKLGGEETEGYKGIMNQIMDILKEGVYEDPDQYQRTTAPINTQETEDYLNKYYPDKELLHPLAFTSWKTVSKSNRDSQKIIGITANTQKVAMYLGSAGVDLATSINFPLYDEENQEWTTDSIELKGWGSDQNKEQTYGKLGDHMNHATDDPKKGILYLMNKYQFTAPAMDAILSLGAMTEKSLIAFYQTPAMKQYLELYGYYSTPMDTNASGEIFDKIASSIWLDDIVNEKLQDPTFSQAWDPKIIEAGSRGPVAKSAAPFIMPSASEMISDKREDKLKVLRYYRNMTDLANQMSAISKVISYNFEGIGSYGELKEAELALEKLRNAKSFTMIDQDQLIDFANGNQIARAVSNIGITRNYYGKHSIGTKVGQEIESLYVDIQKAFEKWKDASAKDFDTLYDKFDSWMAVQSLGINVSKEHITDELKSMIKALPENSALSQYIAINDEGIVSLTRHAKDNIQDVAYQDKAKEEIAKLPKGQQELLLNYMVLQYGIKNDFWKGNYYSILPNEIIKDFSQGMDRLAKNLNIVDFKNASAWDSQAILKSIMLANPYMIPVVKNEDFQLKAYMRRADGSEAELETEKFKSVVDKQGRVIRNAPMLIRVYNLGLRRYEIFEKINHSITNAAGKQTTAYDTYRIADAILFDKNTPINPVEVPQDINMQSDALTVRHDKAIKEANSNRPIEQKFWDGMTVSKESTETRSMRPEIVQQFGSGVSTMKLVKAGVRTRTTRSEGWMKANKPRVNDYRWQTDSLGNKVLTQITAIYDKADPRFKDNWHKEGWAGKDFKRVNENESYTHAIEFQVVYPHSQIAHITQESKDAFHNDPLMMNRVAGQLGIKKVYALTAKENLSKYPEYSLSNEGERKVAMLSTEGILNVKENNKEWVALKNEFNESSDNLFSLTDNTKKGIETQNALYDFLRSKGYNGIDFSDNGKSMIVFNPISAGLDQKDIAELYGIYRETTATKVGSDRDLSRFKKWYDDNKKSVTDELFERSKDSGVYTAEENTSIKPGVSKLFESNPELANAVYEALGFKSEMSDAKYNRTFQNEEYHNAFIEGGLGAVKKVIEKNKQQELSAAKQLSQEVDLLLEFEALNNKSNKTNKENDRVIELYVTLKNSQELDFEYSLKEIGLPNTYVKPIIKITPQQKQQAQQLYSQYLDTIFPDSEVKDIVYHGTNENIEKFDTSKGKWSNAVFFSFKKGDYKRKIEISAIVNAINKFNIDEYIDKKYGLGTVKNIIEERYTGENSNPAATDEYYNLYAERNPDSDYEQFIKTETIKEYQKYGFDYLTPQGYLAVFEPEQIHILGSERDMQRFREFTEESSSDEGPSGQTEPTKEDSSPGTQTRLDFMQSKPRQKMDAKKIEFVRARLAKNFPGIQFFQSAEAFQEHIRSLGSDQDLDLEAYGAAFKNAYWINENNANQEAHIHEMLHIYWKLLPDNHPVKLRLIKYFKTEEAAIIALSGNTLLLLDKETNATMKDRLIGWLRRLWNDIRNTLWHGYSVNKYLKIMSADFWKDEVKQYDRDLSNFKSDIIDYWKLNYQDEEFGDEKDTISQIETLIGKPIEKVSAKDILDVMIGGIKPDHNAGIDYWQAVVTRITGGKLDYVGNDIYHPASEFNDFVRDLRGQEVRDLTTDERLEMDNLYAMFIGDMKTINDDILKAYPDIDSLMMMTPYYASERAKDITEMIDQYKKLGFDLSNGLANASVLRTMFSVQTLLGSIALSHYWHDAMIETRVRTPKEIQNDKNLGVNRISEVEATKDPEISKGVNKIFLRSFLSLLDPAMEIADYNSILNGVFGKDTVRPFDAPLKANSVLFQGRNMAIMRADEASNETKIKAHKTLVAAGEKLAKVGIKAEGAQPGYSHREKLTFLSADGKHDIMINPTSSMYRDLLKKQKAGTITKEEEAIKEWADAYTDFLYASMPMSKATGNEYMYHVEYHDKSTAEKLRAEEAKLAGTGNYVSRKVKAFISTQFYNSYSNTTYGNIHGGAMDSGGKLITFKNYVENAMAHYQTGGFGKGIGAIIALKRHLEKEKTIVMKLFHGKEKLDRKGQVIIRDKKRGLISGLNPNYDADKSSEDIVRSSIDYLIQLSFEAHLEDGLHLVRFSEDYYRYFGKQRKPMLADYVKQFNDLHLYNIAPDSNLGPVWSMYLKWFVEFTGISYMAANIKASVVNLFAGVTQNIRELGFRKATIGFLRIFSGMHINTDDGWKTAFMGTKIIRFMKKRGIITFEQDWSDSKSGKFLTSLKKVAFVFTTFVELVNHGVTIAGSMTQEQWDAIENDGSVTDANKNIAPSRDKVLSYIGKAQLIHGSYHHRGKRIVSATAEGRVFVQLRTWFFDAFQLHGEKEWTDQISGGTQKKGIIRSLSAAPKMAKFLARAATFNNVEAEKAWNSMSVVDRMNLQKLARELFMTILTLVAVAGLGGDDKEKKKYSRLWADIGAVYDINTYMFMFKSPFPVFSKFVDILQALKEVQNVAAGDPTVYKKDNSNGDAGDWLLPRYVVKTVVPKSLSDAYKLANQN